MIKVKRLDCPEILEVGNDNISEGELEARDAIIFFSDINNHGRTYRQTGRRGLRINDSFSAYSNKEVRKQLIKMFHGKCCYCESKVTAIYSGDIEHFRPKGGYGSDHNITKPGYYWLASDWENLLFACPFCNQTYTHEIAEDGKIAEAVLGKLNQFPLLTETYRLNHTQGNLFFSNPVSYRQAYELEERERLLLKPCTDDVDNYFKYVQLGLILPAEGLSPLEEKRAITSIRVYALQRIGLVQAREEKTIQILAQIRRVEEAMQNLNRYSTSSNSVKTWFEGILKKEMIILKKFKDPDQEFSGLARYIIDSYFNSLK